MNSLERLKPAHSYPLLYLLLGGMPAQEIEELHTYRIAYPLVPQVLFPSTRPDIVEGQYLHFTQLPKHVSTEPDTGLFSHY
jgi:hypothetical protein